MWLTNYIDFGMGVELVAREGLYVMDKNEICLARLLFVWNTTMYSGVFAMFYVTYLHWVFEMLSQLALTNFIELVFE